MKFFRTIHAVLGFCLSLLLAMWFLSGFVMIYHSYPSISKHTRLEHQNPINGNLISPKSLDSLISLNESLRVLTLQMNLDEPTFLFRNNVGEQQILATTLDTVPELRNATLDAIRLQWNKEKIVRIDTLYEVDQWILPRKPAYLFPILKYTFKDTNQSQLYLSSTTGKVIQYTTRSERVWAWLGAIPHWVYFTSLRENHLLWIEFVKWTSGISCIMLLAGMILGIRAFYRSRKQAFRSPYRKKWYKWHYIFGLLFGIISITFAFSGLMSLTDVPDWLKKKPKAEQASLTKSHRSIKSISLNDYKLDYRKIIDAYGNVKTIEWAKYNESPYFIVSCDNETKLIDASNADKIVPIRLSEADIHKEISANHPSNNFKVSLLSEHDDYYFSRHKNRVPLPVYRVIIDDELHTRYYFNPETLSKRKYDDNTMLRRFLYNGLHSLHFKFLVDKPLLWNILMYVLLIGGSTLSVTGIVLSIKWAYRKGKKYVSKINTKQK